MKTTPFLSLTSPFALLASLAIGAISLQAADEAHDHDHDHLAAGPNGGKVIHAVEPHLEFFVNEDRTVKITALDEDGKAVPIKDQSILLIGGSRANPTRLTFQKDGDVLTSEQALPNGNDFPVVMQIKPGADAKTVIEKFNLNLNDCPTCDFAEYACACDHGDHAGHDHAGHDHD